MKKLNNSLLEIHTNIITGLNGNYKERFVYEKLLYYTFEYFINEGCKKYNLNTDDSFSAYSDAVLSCIHNITNNRFDGNANIKTYLFQIFNNKCVDLIRKNTTNKQGVHLTMPYSEMLEQLPDGSRIIIENLIDKQKKQAIKHKLEALGQKCKEILLMYEDGLTDKQIAKELEYNNAAVAKTTRLRCLDKLRESLTIILKVV